MTILYQIFLDYICSLVSGKCFPPSVAVVKMQELTDTGIYIYTHTPNLTSQEGKKDKSDRVGVRK